LNSLKTENALLDAVVNDGRNENDSVTQDFGRICKTIRGKNVKKGKDRPVTGRGGP
jgi:hypothetical protein